MNEFSISLLILLSFIYFLGAIVQGYVGFGFMLLSLPIISLFIDVKTAISAGSLFGVLLNGFLFFEYRKSFKIREYILLFIGMILGIPFGTYFLSIMDGSVVKIILAIVLITLSLLSLVGSVKPRILPKWLGFVVGTVSGFLGGAFNTNGPLTVLYLHAIGTKPLAFKSFLAGLFFVSSAVTAVSHFSLSMITPSVFNLFLATSLPALLGIFVGKQLFVRFSALHFNNLILVLVVISSLLLLIR